MELDVNLGLEVEMGKVLDAEEDLAKVLNKQLSGGRTSYFLEVSIVGSKYDRKI